MPNKHLVFLFTCSPYDSSRAREGLEALLAAAIFDQRISVVFMGDGVFQLLSDQQPTEQKNLSKMLKALDMYDIDQLFVHAFALETRNIKHQDFCIPATILSDAEVRTLIASADHTLSF
jgi:tRNA 2-thiouridine synthesizing protein C